MCQCELIYYRELIFNMWYCACGMRYCALTDRWLGMGSNVGTVTCFLNWCNRRFPEISGKDNLTVFSYSGRVKSPEWRWQLRRADLRQFQIFRHGPIIIYTRLPAGGTYYPICMFPRNSKCLIGISDAFFAFVYGYPSSCPRAHCTPNKIVPTLRYTRRPGPVYTGHACRHLPSAVPWISEDRLLEGSFNPLFKAILCSVSENL